MAKLSSHLDFEDYGAVLKPLLREAGQATYRMLAAVFTLGVVLILSPMWLVRKVLLKHVEKHGDKELSHKQELALCVALGLFNALLVGIGIAVFAWGILNL